MSEEKKTTFSLAENISLQYLWFSKCNRTDEVMLYDTPYANNSVNVGPGWQHSKEGMCHP